jgi:hypothetical protein
VLEHLASRDLLEDPDRVRARGDLVFPGLEAAEAPPGEGQEDEADPAPDHPRLVQDLGYFDDALVGRQLDHPGGGPERLGDAQDPPALQEEGQEGHHEHEAHGNPPGRPGVPGATPPCPKRSRAFHHGEPPFWPDSLYQSNPGGGEGWRPGGFLV